MINIPSLWYRNNIIYDPFSGQEWDISPEGFKFFQSLVKGEKTFSSLDDQEKEFVKYLKEEGLILSAKKNVTWILTLKCSLNCKHCYQNLNPLEKSISLEQSRIILQRLLDWGIEHITFSGGDVFLSPHFFEILHTIEKSQQNITVSILTHGYLLATNQIIQKEILKFKKWKPIFQFSLYSDKENVHEEITGIKGSFARTIKSIKFLKNNNFQVLINNVLMKSNFKDRNSLIDFITKELQIPLENINFDTLIFPFVGQKNKEVLQYSLSGDQLQQLLKEEVFEALPVKYLHYARSCTGADTRIAISPKGELFPCNMVQDVLGNVLEESIENILKKGIKALSFKNYKNSVCVNCRTKFCKKCMAFT